LKFITYILLSEKTEQYYIGSTNNLTRRIEEHNDLTRSSWTSKRGPWKIIFQEYFNSRNEAVKLERYLKSFKNKKTLIKYMEGKVSR